MLNIDFVALMCTVSSFVISRQGCLLKFDALEWKVAGAKIIGGCCGVTSQDIEVLGKTLGLSAQNPD